MVSVIGKTEEGKMIKDYRPTFNDESFLVVNAVKSLNKCPLPENSIRVMISEDKVNMSVKSSRLKTPIPLLNISEAEVSKVVNVVIRLNDRVPVIHQSIVHCFNRFERAVAILKDILMPEMS